MRRELKEVAAITAACEPFLAGQKPEIVGAALAELTAIWLAGYFVLNGLVETNKLHEELLQMHMDAIRQLIPIEMERIIEKLRRRGTLQ